MTEQAVKAPVILDFNAIAIGATGEAGEDLTVDQNFDRPLPRAGVAILRLLSYMELGSQQPNNAAHKPAVACVLRFELKHADHQYKTDDGMRSEIIDVHTRKGSTAKSGYKKLFASMNATFGGHHKHFITMIDKCFVAEIYHNSNGKTGAEERKYANLDLNGAWSFKPCGNMDVVNNKFTPFEVEPLQSTPTAFLWENDGVSDEQYVAMWDSIEIEGTYTKKEGDTEVEKSKNFHQLKVMGGTDWEGSRLQGLVTEFVSIDEGLVLPEDEEQPTSMVESAVVVEEFATVTTPQQPVQQQQAVQQAQQQPVQQAAVASPENALAAMAALAQ